MDKDTSGVHVWLVLLKAFHSVMAYTAPNLQASGLGESDFRVLEVLLHKGPLPVNAIGPKVWLTSGSISTAVDRLYARGLVTRGDNQKDRRVRVVALTREGKRLILRVFQSHAAEVERVASVLTSGERAELIESLKKLGKHADTLQNS